MKHLLTLTLLALSCAPALAFEHPSGFKLELPDAFDIRQLEDWELEGDVTAFVVTTRDPSLSVDFSDELCRIAFALSPESSLLSQDELNNVEAGDDSLNAYRTQPIPRIKVLGAMSFIHGDIVGSELVATSKHVPGLTMLVSNMLTPRARTTISCSADSAQFEAARPVFERIRAGVTPPS